MFKKIKNMNTEISELIKKNITYYTLSFTTLIFAFLFLNISFISIYNLNQANKSLNKSYSLKVYINNNVSQNAIEEIEKEILSVKGIENISYIDKKVALQKLTNQLEITSNNMVNPLLNSFQINTSGEVNLSNAKLVIDEINGVKEVIINDSNVTFLNGKIARNKKLIMWIVLITLIPIHIMIFNIMHSTVLSQSHDIQSKLYLGLEKKEILRPYYFINNIKFISAGIIGSLIFFNLYEIVRQGVSEYFHLVPLMRVGIIVGIFIAVISLIFPFISSKLIKVKR